MMQQFLISNRLPTLSLFFSQPSWSGQLLYIFVHIFFLSNIFLFFVALMAVAPGWKINIHNCISSTAAHRHGRDSSNKKLMRQTNKFKLNCRKLPARVGGYGNPRKKTCRKLPYRLLACDVKSLSANQNRVVSIVKYFEHARFLW